MLLSLRRNYPATGGPPRARYIGTEEKMDAAEVARIGFRAMMDGEGDVVAGLKNKIRAAVASVTPSAVLAEQHRKKARPGTAKPEDRRS
jgi:hypothetical protein